jgi:hypothetical protein
MMRGQQDIKFKPRASSHFVYVQPSNKISKLINIMDIFKTTIYQNYFN